MLFCFYPLFYPVFCILLKASFIKTHVHMYVFYINTWPITPAAGATLRRPSSCPEMISNWFSIQCIGRGRHPHLNGHFHLAQTPLASLSEAELKDISIFFYILYIYIFLNSSCSRMLKNWLVWRNTIEEPHYFALNSK